MFRILRYLLQQFWRFRSQNDDIGKENLLSGIFLPEVGTTWDTYQLKILSEIKSLGISKFRLSPTVIGTMDPPMPYLVNNILALNISDRARLKELAKNYVRTGGGLRGTIFFNSPDSRVHKILSMFELKSELNKFLGRQSKWSTDTLEIVEFGGGLGQMAELVIRELKPKTYKIIDLPLISRLAMLYLKKQNLNFEYEFFSQEDELPLLDNSLKVFISSWAVSEISLEKREPIEKIMQKMDYLFIEMQDYFDGIDNYGWITKFLIKNPQFISTSSRSDRSMRSRIYKIHKVK